jgi:hypothetical protein
MKENAIMETPTNVGIRTAKRLRKKRSISPQ